MIEQPPFPATAAGLLLALGCAIAAAIVLQRVVGRAPLQQRLLVTGAVAGLTFQVVHVLEHALQLGFWFARPDDKPWLSSWAAGSADGLAWFCSLLPAGQESSMGVEALHLTGNVIFLGALAAWQMAVSSEDTPGSLRLAERIQTAHVLEHVVLVSTLLVTGTANGLSTLFGLVDGSALVALRVWFHFGINAAATLTALHAAAACRHLLRRDTPKRTAGSRPSQLHLSRAVHDLADPDRRMAVLRERSDRPIRVGIRYHQHHADTHVEYLSLIHI